MNENDPAGYCLLLFSYYLTVFASIFVLEMVRFLNFLQKKS